jgi:hypothetical protein
MREVKAVAKKKLFYAKAGSAQRSAQSSNKKERELGDEKDLEAHNNHC